MAPVAGMPPGGEDVGEPLARKYGSTPAQQEQIRNTIREHIFMLIYCVL